MNKKKTAVIAALICALAILAAGTTAFFTTEARTRNVITTGKIDVELLELQSDGSSYPTSPVAVMPGTSVSKIVRVKSAEDAADAYIRAQVTFDIRDAQGQNMSVTPEDILDIDYNTGAWTFSSGWWYCENILGGGGESPELFTTISFDGENMNNDYQGSTMYVTVAVQAVQVQNNPGSTALSAEGWPQT